MTGITECRLVDGHTLHCTHETDHPTRRFDRCSVPCWSSGVGGGPLLSFGRRSCARMLHRCNRHSRPPGRSGLPWGHALGVRGISVHARWVPDGHRPARCSGTHDGQIESGQSGGLRGDRATSRCARTGSADATFRELIRSAARQVPALPSLQNLKSPCNSTIDIAFGRTRP